MAASSKLSIDRETSELLEPARAYIYPIVEDARALVLLNAQEALAQAAENFETFEAHLMRTSNDWFAAIAAEVTLSQRRDVAGTIFSPECASSSDVYVDRVISCYFQLSRPADVPL